MSGHIAGGKGTLHRGFRRPDRDPLVTIQSRVPSNWRDGWESTGQEFQGGQGKKFQVLRRTPDQLPGFAKTIKKSASPQKRGRFRKEVVAYETILNAGLPELYEHNANEWQDENAELCMILEFIPGLTLEEYIHDNGALELAAIRDFVDPLLASIEACHQQDSCHRDIKPKNIVLRGSEPGRPVLVDFGLSFNETDEGTDLTLTGEEVGNRFLHLPEQASGTRSTLSDITQTAGIIFYALTGIEPKILVDEQGQMPHQREKGSQALALVAEGRELDRLRGFFDRAFASDFALRFPTIEQLRDALVSALTPEAPGSDYDSLVARVVEVARSAEVAERARSQQRLENAIGYARRVVIRFASENGLSASETGYFTEFDHNPPSCSTQLALVLQGDQAIHATYMVELHGTDTILQIDGEVRWRGPNPIDEGFKRAVLEVAFARFLTSRDK